MQARGRAGVRQGVRDALRDALRLTCGLEAPWNTSNASTGASQHRGVSSRATFRPLREEKEAPGLRWRQRGRREPPSLCAERTLGGWEAETGPPLTSVGLSVSCNRKWARRWRLKIQSCTPPPYAKRCVTVPTLAKTAPVSMNKSTLKALVVFPVCGSSTSRCRSAGKRVAVGSCSQRERERESDMLLSLPAACLAWFTPLVNFERSYECSAGERKRAGCSRFGTGSVVFLLRGLLQQTRAQRRQLRLCAALCCSSPLQVSRELFLSHQPCWCVHGGSCCRCDKRARVEDEGSVVAGFCWRRGRAVAETARGFPWLLPRLQGVHVLQQAQNTLFPLIVFADFIARV